MDTPLQRSDIDADTAPSDGIQADGFPIPRAQRHAVGRGIGVLHDLLDRADVADHHRCCGARVRPARRAERDLRPARRGGRLRDGRRHRADAPKRREAKSGDRGHDRRLGHIPSRTRGRAHGASCRAQHHLGSEAREERSPAQWRPQAAAIDDDGDRHRPAGDAVGRVRCRHHDAGWICRPSSPRRKVAVESAAAVALHRRVHRAVRVRLPLPA